MSATTTKPFPPPADLLVLGIESSCDETSASVVRRTAEGRGEILSNVVRSQWEQHRPYGGVVPEIAARAHVECLDQIIREAMASAGVPWSTLSGIAATAGPGLMGGLIVGTVTAKTLALVHDRPFIAVNHLEAHALTVGLTDGLAPPYLLLLISGGHTQLLLVEAVGRYTRIGTTIDDALGEAFDKTAKLLGLGQPGGPAVELKARDGNPKRFAFPRPLQGRDDANFSFAGLKTAVRQQAIALAPLHDRDIADLCASFQCATADSLCDRTRQAMRRTRGFMPTDSPPTLVVAGGVAANQTIRTALDALIAREDWRISIPPIGLCTDNAAMVAWAGAEQLARGLSSPLDTPTRARWPLDADAHPLLGSGRLGAKA